MAMYATRRDAEMAHDRLDDAGIRAFITADDAGGMHPQLQPAHGVKLRVMQRQAAAARTALADAGLLPEAAHAAPHGAPSASDDAAPDALTFTSDRGLFRTTGMAYLVLFALVVLAIVAGLLFSVAP